MNINSKYIYLFEILHRASFENPLFKPERMRITIPPLFDPGTRRREKFFTSQWIVTQGLSRLFPLIKINKLKYSVGHDH